MILFGDVYDINDKRGGLDRLEKYRNKVIASFQPRSDLRYFTVPCELSIGLCLADDGMNGIKILPLSATKNPFYNALGVSSRMNYHSYKYMGLPCSPVVIIATGRKVK